MGSSDKKRHQFIHLVTRVCVFSAFGVAGCDRPPASFKQVDREYADEQHAGSQTRTNESDNGEGERARGSEDSKSTAEDADRTSGRSPGTNPSGSGDDTTSEPGVPGISDALAVNWSLPCERSSANSSGKIVGGGRHQVAVDSQSKLAVTFTGSVCQPANTPRDLVFVVDVTGSMGGGAGNDFNHDPHVNGTCGRLEAIRHVLSMMPNDGTARVSLMTFNSRIAAKSRQFFATGEQLMDDLQSSKRDSIDNIICSADGVTDYSVALNGARQMLVNHGRAEAQKEVYFISDGVPTVNNGVREAQSLRASGVIIAPIMLIGDEWLLRDHIASRDPQGQPLFRKVGEASKLADALDELAMNRLTKVELRYRPMNSGIWRSANVRERLSGYNFQLPAITFSLLEDYEFEVILDALDSRGNHSLVRGQLQATAQ